MHRFLSRALSSTILFVGCASGGLTRVSDESLTPPPAEHLPELARRRAALAEARAALERAESEEGAARLAYEADRTERDSAEDRLEANEALRERAKALGLQDEARDYETNRATLERIMEEARRRAQLAKARVDFAHEQLELRRAELRLADAELEEARATAARAKDGPVAEGIELSRFKTQVASAHEAVASWQERAARAWRRVEDRQKKHQRALELLPETSASTRDLLRAERDNEKLSNRVQLLEKRVRELERENARLMTRVTRTSTLAASF